VGAERVGRRHITIAGAGPGGICAGIKLKQAGFEDFVILERSTSVGGTWANNRYPGLCCDTPSLLYSFTFEQKLDWTRTCARQPEIRQYMQHCVDKYELAPHIRFNAEVRGARWDDDACRWLLTTADGWTTSSDVFIGALGMFNQLSWPEIPGLEDFGRRVIHTGNWPEAGVDLGGKSVAVIGCAASATQAIPEIARDAASLVVYLRTANWVVPKEDEPYSEATLEEMRLKPEVGLESRNEYLDWAEAVLTFDKPELMKELEEKALENLAAVDDPAIREQLRPRVPFGSQRILFSNDFYPTFNRHNVELVSDEIESITPHGVRTVDGRERAADVLILATGYQTTKFLSVIDVAGRSGVRLGDAWRDGAHAYLGITVARFPNLFMLYGPNTNQGSILLMLEHEVDYIVGKLEHMRQNDITWMDVRKEAMDEYNAALQRHLDSVEVLQTIGTRYYRAASGRIVTQWPYTMAEYRARTTRPDQDAFEEHRAERLQPASVAG
jgi:cation diffusion facilitator CzcD-associated flavoprotein CzcO